MVAHRGAGHVDQGHRDRHQNPARVLQQGDIFVLVVRGRPMLVQVRRCGHHQRQQGDQTPPVGRPIILQGRHEGPGRKVDSRPEPALQTARASARVFLSDSTRDRGGQQDEPVQRPVMVRKPGHPGVGRRFDQGKVGVRQERQQAIDRSQDQVNSPKSVSGM